MIVVFLTVMVAMILIRTLNSDIANYNDPAALEDARDESGWKLVHADVFRPPSQVRLPPPAAVVPPIVSSYVCVCVCRDRCCSPSSWERARSC
jgi:hypothetical protein